MAAILVRIAQLLIMLGVIIPAYGFGIPKPKLGDILGELPSLNLGLDEEEPITTSLDDAMTEVPFLDDYNPKYFLPMGELPRGPGGSFLLMPGCYEIRLESFCLHAGVAGPGGGDGYLLAPLKGPRASIIEHILLNSAKNRDVPQHDIQVLIWAILARTKISDMNPNMQATAARLLTTKEIVELNGSALDLVKNELMGRYFGKLPPAVRQVMEAEANLRSMLSSGGGTYAELESIAVPVYGNVPLSKDSREVPQGRWSFSPDGYFIRFYPSGYSETLVQVSVPDLCMVERDAQNRITAIGDAWGNSLEIGYAAGTTTYTFTGPQPHKPNVKVNGAWTASSAEPAGMAKWAKEHEKQVGKLCGNKADISEIMEYGRLAYLLGSVVSGDAGDSAVLLVKQAWQDAVCELLAVAGEASLGELIGDASGDASYDAFGGTYPGISAFPNPEAFIIWLAKGHELPTFDNLENMRRMREREKQWEERKRKARERRQLKEFQPTKKAATPGNRGRQRLALGDRPKSDDDDENNGDNGPKPPSYNNAKSTMNKFKYGVSGANTVGGPAVGPGASAGISGFAIPMALSTYMIGMSTDIWTQCTDAISQDPPDPNYDEIAELEVADYTPVESSDDVPQARADVFNAFARACLNLNASMRAAVKSLDRHGGAIEAGDSEWIIRQAEAVVYYKRLSGVYMYDVADALDGLLSELRSEGVDDIIVTADSFRDYQNRLRTQGFNDDELAAARIVGLTDEEADSYKNDILSADPDEVAGSVMDVWQAMIDVLYEVGWDLYCQWDVVPPGEWDANFLYAYSN